MEKDLIKELHQMNIYLKSIAESLADKSRPKVYIDPGKSISVSNKKEKKDDK